MPQIAPFDFGDPVDAQDMATVNCAVIKGDTPFEITWRKDGFKLDTNDGVFITRSGQRTSVLTIDSVRSRHAGNFTCFVENNAGRVEHTAALIVNGTKNRISTDKILIL